MATENQLQANRENGSKSHGPVTEEGKAAVRLNALKHGLRARTVVLPGESQEDFDQLCQDLEEEWQPQTPTELACLEQMAIHQWKLARAERHEAWAHSLPLGDPSKSKQLRFAFEFQLRWERAFQRSLREIQRLQKDRRIQAKEAAAEAAAEKARQPKHPDLPARFRDTKDENGQYMRVVDVPKKVWNGSVDSYDVVYSSKLKYPEKLRPLFSTFVREFENPTPEAADPRS